MSVIINPMEQLQPDFAARLQTILYFADIHIGAPRVFKDGDKIVAPKTIEDKIDRALNGLLTTGGKAGASVRVFQPSYRVNKPNLPGPQGVLVLLVRCEVHPIINFAATGTGKYVSAIGTQVLIAGHDFHLDGICSGLYADGDCFLPYFSQDTGLMTVDVLLTAKCPLPPRTEVIKPAGAVGGGLLSLTCVTAGAAIWYTVDGTFPAPPALVPASTAVLYAAPFNVNSGDVFRFAGFKDGFDGSSVAYIQIP